VYDLLMLLRLMLSLSNHHELLLLIQLPTIAYDRA
jgi:hypothetical protein